MTGPGDAASNRILVAVDSSQQGYIALETAAECAAHMRKHLLALFIEDVNLVKLAALPFARELDGFSGAMRPLDPDNVERSLQAGAREIKQRLAEESRKRSISASMQVVRGHYFSTVMELAGKSDIVFLNYAARQPFLRTSSYPGRGRIGQVDAAPRPVWVYFDGSEATEHCLKLASGLSTKYGSELTVILTDGPEHDQLELRVARMLGSAFGFQVMSLATAKPSRQSARERRCPILMLPRSIVQGSTADDDILNRIQCPRILVLV